jgi:hypothetical protein
MSDRSVMYVPIPVGMGLMFDGNRWTVEMVPPDWFLEEMDAGNDDLGQWTLRAELSLAERAQVERIMAEEVTPHQLATEPAAHRSAA